MATVLAMVTDPAWLEARALALGELAARVQVSRGAHGIRVRMTRRVRRDVPGLVAKVLPAESDQQFEEDWIRDGAGWAGTYSMVVVGQPVRATADFSLVPAGKGCIYRVDHETRCSVPLIGGPVAKFAQAQVEQACSAELQHLLCQLQQRR